MSIGLYRHPVLGETRKYILNNKHVLETRNDTRQTDEWADQYAKFREAFLRNKQVKFYLLPEEIYVDREISYYEHDEYPRLDSMRIILYDHFILTLREELQTRIKKQEPFSNKELWFLLYALVCGTHELMEVRQQTGCNDELVDITPDTILLNEHGDVKLIGYYSTPLRPKSKTVYRGFEANLSQEVYPQKFEICCSGAVGRVVGSLVLLKEMEEFLEGKQKLFCDAKLLEELKPFEERLGLLYRILRLMLTDNLGDRLMVCEVKALLLPYEEAILSFDDFTPDSELSRESLLGLFLNQ